MPDRLFLRPFEQEDGESFYRNVMADCEAGLFGSDQPLQYADAQKYIADRIPLYDRPHFYDFAVVRKSDGEVIGEVNAAYISPDTADIGYVIGRPYRGQGNAKEAVQLLITYLRNNGIRRIYGACMIDNAASAAVMRACGLRETTDVPERVKARESGGVLRWYFLKTGT